MSSYHLVIGVKGNSADRVVSATMVSSMRLFQEVKRAPGLTERTELQLEELIVGGSLSPGDRLPSERDLGEQLGVSKTVVREAIRSLSAKGLVDVRAGSGTYIRGFDGSVMSGHMNLLLRSGKMAAEDIHEVRQALEVRIAGRAAERAEPRDIESLEETITALKAPGMTAITFAETDVAFHRRLATAARNPLFSMLAMAINDVMIEVRLRAYDRGPEAVERALDHHTLILASVRRKDVEGTRRAMELHLDYSLSVMQHTTERRGVR